MKGIVDITSVTRYYKDKGSNSRLRELLTNTTILNNIYTKFNLYLGTRGGVVG